MVIRVDQMTGFIKPLNRVLERYTTYRPDHVISNTRFTAKIREPDES